MMTLPGHPVEERFRAAIAGQLGLWFGDDKREFLDTILSGCAEAQRLSREDYVQRLEDAPRKADLALLGRALTVGETYFFRNIEQFNALAEIAARTRTPTLRVLSAGCATGEEAYSLALTLRECTAATLLVRAVDVNEEALAAARRGWFSPWSLRATSPEMKARWFQPHGKGWVLDPDIRQSVSFAPANLAEEDTALWAPGSYDVIFCRNVMMYFTPVQARALVARMAGALVPGGYLFLGHAETLRGVSDAFELCHTHGTFYYQRIAAYGRHAGVPAVASVPPEGARPLAASAAPVAGWYDAIHQASARIADLAAPAAGPIRQELPGEPVLADALGLLRSERFAEALAQLRRLPLVRQHDPDSLLLEAMLLVQQNEPGAAEKVCRHLLARDAVNAGEHAGAHYAMALCREQAGDNAGATEHDRTALNLDPHFAMPRLHLGLLARRAGQRGAARRDLQQALHLLAGEDDARLLLFGGGFGRAALQALCESALRDCGGRA